MTEPASPADERNAARDAPVTAVVRIDQRHPALPASAMAPIRSAARLLAGDEVPERVRAELGATPWSDRGARPAAGPVVLVLAEDEPLPSEAADAPLHRMPAVAGSALLRAVRVMDTLRAPGGCPWDAEQTHQSLRTYLLEETYELLDALRREDRAEVQEELGDVLLQVLFHARIAQEHPDSSFDIDDVATTLVGKLIGRHPHVFATDQHGGGPDEQPVRTPGEQETRWRQLKQQEKRRASAVDGVPPALPALALAGKLAERAGRDGLPEDLWPAAGSRPGRIFRLAAEAATAGDDLEGELGDLARRFAEQVRQAETRAGGRIFGAAQWRRSWPGLT